MIQKIEQRPLAGFQSLRKEQIVSHDFAQNRGGGEVGGGHPQNAKRGMVWIYGTNFTSFDALLNGADQLIVKGPQIPANDPGEISRRLHRFPLDEPRIIRMRGEKIEISGYQSVQAVAGREFCAGLGHRPC